ncbi:MAG: choice-of-anchor D domain-containing protein, partial [Chitinophagaceae bacterium]
MQGDNAIFAGTVWAATHGSNSIVIFEPQDFGICTGVYGTADEDSDGYTNADEIDNASNPCSAASMPPDSDQDKISDLNDPDDDNDGIDDKHDAFSIDATNGSNTSLPLTYDLFNYDPGTGFFGLGFTGLMSNSTIDYYDLFNEDNLIAGGAVGAFTVVNVTAGDALGTTNTQENAFQAGVHTNGFPFTLRTRMLGPFFNSQTLEGVHSQGIYIGNGDQDNFLKITLTSNGGAGGIQVVVENEGVPTVFEYPLTGGIPTSTMDLLLKFNPTNNTVQAAYACNNDEVLDIGTPVPVSGATLAALQGATTLAVGIISTSQGGPTFTASWDFLKLNYDAVTATGAWQTLAATGGTITPRHEDAYVQAGNNFYLIGGRGIKPVQEYNPITKTWSAKALTPVELNHFQAVSLEGLIYVAGAFGGAYPHEIPVPNIYLYNPTTNQWITGPSIPQARRRGAAGAVVHNKKIYLVGGIIDGHWTGTVKWFDEFDPATNTWKALPDAPHERDHFQAAILDNKLYLTGGRRSSGSTNQVFNLTVPEVDIFDFTTGTWSTLPSSSNLPTLRAGTTTVGLGNEIVVIGGESGTQAEAHREAEALHITTNTWRRLADLQQGRHGTQAIVNNNCIYIAAGSGGRGSSPELNTQEAFYLFTPTTPTGEALVQSQLSVPASLAFGTINLNAENVRTITLSNTSGNQGILLSSISLTGSGAFTFSSPIPLPFVLAVGSSVTIPIVFKPTAAGQQTGNLVINHSGQTTSNTVSLTGEGSTALYRLNAGGQQVSTSLGSFSSDVFFAPSPGSVKSTTNAINGTTDDVIYQSERYGSTFGYNLPVSNGQYKVVLHFAEIFFTTTGSRVFDVSIEGTRLLDNYDIVARAGGGNTAKTETFTILVTDGTLNINFSSLLADGGVNNAKVSAIEVLTISGSNLLPTANAGADQTITLPISQVQLQGRGTDPDGTITGYQWSQLSGPNTAAFSNPAEVQPSVSGLVQGSYVFALVVTDNQGEKSPADQVAITVNPAETGGPFVYRLNAGGPQLVTTLGTFAADAFFSPSPGSTWRTTAAINNTTDDALYQTERWGKTFGYNLPVSNGQYKVVLHFAEIYFTTTGKRIFDVSIEGAKVLD